MQVERRGVIAWFIHNPVAANLVMLFVVVAGLLSEGSIRKEVFPQQQSHVIFISAGYPSASPAEVEEGVTLKLEDAVRNIVGIKKVSAISYTGYAVMNIEVDEGFDIDEILDEVKTQVDGISSFPREVEKVIIRKTRSQALAIQLQVHGKLDEFQAKELAYDIKRDLLSNTIVKKVDIWGIRPYEMSIEISEDQLRKYNLTLRDVASKIRLESVNLPSGMINARTGSIILRVEGKSYSKAEFENIVLLTSEDGRIVRVGDIAKVNDGFVDWGAHSYFDGEYSVGMVISAVGDQDVIEIANAVKAYKEKRQKTLPEGVHLSDWADITYYLDSRLNMMVENMVFGAILVFIVLAFFMDLKVAFWVMAGLPVCYLGAFVVMPIPWIDISINMVSLFGFILVLGIIVDDAIVVGESVHTETELHGFSRETVLLGTQKVALPSAFGVLTTIVAFLPTLFVTGPWQHMVNAVGFVVCFCLLVSLLESKWVLPAHLASMHDGFFTKIRSSWHEKWQQRNNEKLQNWVKHSYAPLLEKSLRNRYSVLAGFVAVLLLTLALVTSGVVRYSLLPSIPDDFLRVTLHMGEGTPEEKTEAAMDRILAGLHKVEAEYQAEYGQDRQLVKHIYSQGVGGITGFYQLELVKDEDRKIDSAEIARRWRKAVGEIEGAQAISFSSEAQSGSTSLSYMLVSDNKEELKNASTELLNELRTFNGLSDFSSSIEGSREQYILHLKPKAVAMGLTLADISNQVREAFFGAEAQRFQRGEEEVKVLVRYPEERRTSLLDLEELYIHVPGGRSIPLKELVNIEASMLHGDLTRINFESAAVMSVHASRQVDTGKVDRYIKGEFFPQLFEKYPSVSYRMDGSKMEEKKLEGDIRFYFVLALMAVFVLLAIPLRSYFQPLIIMSVIPFGIVGAVLGHLLLGYHISMMSLFGIVALSGVVVNDSLLMVDFVNRAVREGMPLIEAVKQAGQQRFRAIMLTTVTTFIGVVPMMMERSIQAESMIPMAVSLAFGIVFATAITLILVPCLYLMMEDIKSLFIKPVEKA